MLRNPEGEGRRRRGQRLEGRRSERSEGSEGSERSERSERCGAEEAMKEAESRDSDEKKHLFLHYCLPKTPFRSCDQWSGTGRRRTPQRDLGTGNKFHICVLLFLDVVFMMG